ncbi:hypothetical protein ACH5RR_026365 [Cinchona calisaya]|uniref:Uncharacterized protein n=1 Tax=Cinchona calisaya TaxID=153742 RepID=A0ABD2Z7E2_9GENT
MHDVRDEKIGNSEQFKTNIGADHQQHNTGQSGSCGANFSQTPPEVESMGVGIDQPHNGGGGARDNCNRDGAITDEDKSSNEREFAGYFNYYYDDYFEYETPNEEQLISQVLNEGPSQPSHEKQVNGEQTTCIDNGQRQLGRVEVEKNSHGQKKFGGQNMEEQNVG